jgi:hypothetical protein
MPPPTFLIGPSLSLLGWARRWHKRRRKVKLTVHRGYETYALAAIATSAAGPSEIIEAGGERYYVTVTNASQSRSIVVTHVWFETEPRVDVLDPELPARLKYSDPWETSVPVDEVPADADDALWLARCLLSPDDKVVKSKPERTSRRLGRCRVATHQSSTSRTTGGPVPGITGVCTARASPSFQARLTHGSKPNPCSQAAFEGPYGIRTRAAAVRGRCPRPLDEWAVAGA